MNREGWPIADWQLPSHGAAKADTGEILKTSLKALRGIGKMSQESLAERAGIDRSFVSDAENGKYVLQSTRSTASLQVEPWAMLHPEAAEHTGRTADFVGDAPDPVADPQRRSEIVEHRNHMRVAHPLQHRVEILVRISWRYQMGDRGKAFSCRRP